MAVTDWLFDEITLTLNSPITEEQWDLLTDVDLEHTPKIEFHTKRGKTVEYVKPKHGRWLAGTREDPCQYVCSMCGRQSDFIENYCPNCGAKMNEVE